MATASSRRLLVAVHDVTPAHEERLQGIFALLDRLEITRYALFVVPNWHGEWPLGEHPRFVEEVRRRQANGAEIFLHGLRHDEVGRERSVWQQLRVAGRTGSSAEFMFLPSEQARARIDRGIELFAAGGLEPVGFVPPAWLHGPGLDGVLRERGLRVTESFWGLWDVLSGTRMRNPALSWSTQRQWRSDATALIAEARKWIERGRELVRVAIHPPDVEVPVVARSVERTLKGLLEERTAVGYREVLGSSGRGKTKLGVGAPPAEGRVELGDVEERQPPASSS